jgi:hypothetical protein
MPSDDADGSLDRTIRLDVPVNNPTVLPPWWPFPPEGK